MEERVPGLGLVQVGGVPRSLQNLRPGSLWQELQVLQAGQAQTPVQLSVHDHRGQLQRREHGPALEGQSMFSIVDYIFPKETK